MSIKQNNMLAATLCAGAMIAHQVGGKATRDALFLSNFDVTALPTMIIAASLLSVVVVLISSRLMSAYGPARVVPVAFAVSAVLTLVEWGIVFESRRVAAVVVYLHIASFGAVLISGFWSVINEHFDPHTAKKRISRIAGAGTLGGLLGGVLAERLAVSFDIATILPLLAAGHLVCAWLVRALPPLPGMTALRAAEGAAEGSATDSAAAEPAGSEMAAVKLAATETTTMPALGAAPETVVELDDRRSAPGGRSGLAILAEVSYLRNLAALILLGTVGATLIDYVFKVRATEMFGGSGAELMRFFAAFYTAVALITFLVQTSMGRMLLERLGLSRAVASVPAIVALGGVGSILAPGLVTAGIVRAGENVLRSSLFRSGYELFFTPIPAHDKRATKSIIDVGFDRLGDAVGGGLVSLMLFIGPQSVQLWLMILAIGVGVAGLIVTRRLHQGYVQALEQSLITHGLHLDIDSIDDRLTRTTVMRTMAAINMSQVLKIPIQEALAAGDEPGADDGAVSAAGAAAAARTAAAGTAGGQLIAPRADTDAALRETIDARHVTPSRWDTGESLAEGVARADGQEREAAPDPYLQRIADLRSGDQSRIRAVLEDRANLAPELAPHAIPLLAWDTVSRDVIRALREIAPRITGQLVDAMLDPDEEFAIRRRVPRVLSACTDQRAGDGLLKGLQDRRFEVRFQCGRALYIIREQSSEVVIDRETVMAAVAREAAVSRRVWESQSILDQLDEQEALPMADEVLRDRTNRSLEHVFTILSLVLPPEPLRIAFRCLHTDDPGLRGTALEYLESVLPPEIRDRLWPLLEGEGHKVKKGRDGEEVLAELLQSHRSIELNLAALRARRAEEEGEDGGT